MDVELRVMTSLLCNLKGLLYSKLPNTQVPCHTISIQCGHPPYACSNESVDSQSSLPSDGV